jgi:hypothetical protein
VFGLVLALRLTTGEKIRDSRTESTFILRDSHISFSAPKKTQNKTLMTSAGSALSEIGVLRGAVIAQRSAEGLRFCFRKCRLQSPQL